MTSMLLCSSRVRTRLPASTCSIGTNPVAVQTTVPAVKQPHASPGFRFTRFLPPPARPPLTRARKPPAFDAYCLAVLHAERPTVPRNDANLVLANSEASLPPGSRPSVSPAAISPPLDSPSAYRASSPRFPANGNGRKLAI